MIKCPNCGRERLVVEGKRKKCRKCGTPLTSRPPKPVEPPKLTVEQLTEQYPERVAEIIERASAEAVKEEIGDLTSELLLEHYPELVEELTAAVKETTAKETAKETAENVRTKIGGMSVKKFAAQFSELYEKIVKDAGKPDKKAPQSPKGGTNRPNK